MNDKKVKIYDSGKALFSSKGFKNTNVCEITKKAGMATGTFYNYYSSKDQLFMEVFMDENVILKKNIVETVDLDAHPQIVMNEMMTLNIQGMMINPILKEWYNRDIFNKIEQVYKEENGLEKLNFLYGSFVDVVKKWQLDGKFRKDISAETIMAIFSALINIDTHKDEVGLQHFPQVIEYLAQFTMEGLMDCKNIKTGKS